MKKIFLYSFTLSILCLVVIGSANSQNTIASINSAGGPGYVSSGAIDETGAGNLNAIDLSELNKKVTRSFTKDYKGIPDAKWSKSPNGLYVANFIRDDKKIFTFYSQKGIHECEINYYKEDKLPLEIRHLVKSHYYDFNIHQVTEVKRSNKIAYVIKMENSILWKTVKVVDGEMEVTEEYYKR